MRTRIQLSFVINVSGELPEMTKALNDALEGALKGLYPGLGEAIEAGRVRVDIEGGGNLGVTHLKARK